MYLQSLLGLGAKLLLTRDKSIWVRLNSSEVDNSQMPSLTLAVSSLVVDNVYYNVFSRFNVINLFCKTLKITVAALSIMKK